MDNEKKIIFDAIFIDLMKFDEISKKMNIGRKDVSRYYDKFKEDEKITIEKIQRIRQLYNNKNNKETFKFKCFKNFYEWHIEQYEKQGGKCYYCEIDESIISELFLKGILTSARSLNRGNHLEVERKNSNTNEYSSENCVLACYFCNNDKSDIIDEKDYFKYLKNRKEFFETKHKEISKTKIVS